MFGNLFEEEEEEGFSSLSSKGRVVKGVDEPPPPRGKSNLCGIKNQGGTCYLNSLLQTLLFTPEFREALFSLGQEELGRLEDKDKPEAKVRVIPLELQRLFARLLLVDQQSASTADLTDSFGWNSSEGTNQHDVQELNRILFSALEHSLVDTSGSAFIHRLYHGTIVNSIVCKECGNVSQRQEDFLDLTVCVCGVLSLEEALWNMFVEEELFEGNNLYRCAQCDRLVTAAKSAKLRKLPPFMTVSLLRFSFDFAKFERYKETGRYTFPLSINLRPFCEPTDAEDSDYSYELFSVIIHKGGCYGGHYHAYIRDIDELGQWEPPVHEPKLQEDDPLSILMAIISQESSKSVLLDQLGQKLMDKIGSSWSKKFRKQYGPIGKVILKCLLMFSDLTLKSSNFIFPDQHNEPPTAPDGGGSHWFDLNDSTVTSIRESDIEKQFQGKESAYMLFYRKTQLHRPAEARNNPQYKVPTHLVQRAQEENVKLQEMREKCEATNNTVELCLHLASSYRLENGALQPVGKEPSENPALSFDRRKTVGDLRLAIYQMQELWEGDMALTVAKSLPAGLHLYNTLTDDNISLNSAGIYNNTDLFVWNGRDVCGATVLTGAEWEPVLLTVVRPFLGEDAEPAAAEDPDACEESGAAFQNGGESGLKKEARGFAGGSTLGEVKEALGEPKESLLCQEHRAGRRREEGAGEGGGASGWRVFPPDDMQRTLKELSLRDGDALLVLEPQSFDSRSVRCDGHEAVLCTRPFFVNVLLTCVQHVHPERRRRHGDDAVGLPLAAGGVSPSCERRRRRGGGEEEIKTMFFSQCLKAMLEAVGLDGSCWHLRKLDWCEEVGEPLMDELCLYLITFGYLCLSQGFLTLTVWLHQDPKTITAGFNHTDNGPTGEQMSLSLRSVGQVEISDEATLEDLKTQVHSNVWSEVLLNIKMGVPGEKSYYPAEEIVWDASHDSSPRSLRSCLAAHYGLSPDSLLLAKHQPDKYTWEEISNWTQQVSKKKKKKKAESLLGAPFHLKDGDMIGIKVLIMSLFDLYIAVLSQLELAL
uniref:Ubiquitin specific peptidase 40 n=1 Tax=Salarias fasciatus TaxID=181472 RepID=A0A672HVH5_SALFA